MVWYSYLQRNDPLPSISLYDVTTNKVLVLMSKTNPVCRVCSVELTDENWYPSLQKTNRCICKRCLLNSVEQWRKANPEKYKAQRARWQRKQGRRPFYENKECAQFLGVHIAERILSHVFKNVQRMPFDNPGFDFICSKGMKIDVKSSILHNYPQRRGAWVFRIRKNGIANYFLCIAFDDRENLNPLHLWLLPGSKFNQQVTAMISLSTIHKWDEYKLPIDRVVSCCEAMR